MYIEDPELRFISHTGQNSIQPLLYLPFEMIESAGKKKARGLILIIHGMAEHQLRYQSFAEYLSKHNYIVCTLDLPGHGRTAPDEKHLGYFSEHDGSNKIQLDIIELMNILIQMYPGIPPIIFGHSMGSLIARRFCATSGIKLAAAIFSGTPAPNAIAGIAVKLAEHSVKKNGGYYRDDKLNKLMSGKFQSRLPQALTPYDWISSDEEEVNKYVNDPFCGFVFTASGFKDLFTMVKSVSSRKWAASVQSNLPIMLFSGEQDPVGGFGLGVKKINRWLQKYGHPTHLILYENGRHEMLNEQNRQIVWENVTEWLNELLPDVVK
ncbi:MAG: alpha/beta hydrolase [Eubacteriales bacterium]|nr:alpha/beta hydrolase [Eubacteriales bacterium]